MIGHYLLTLTARQEHRVLTMKMSGPYRHYVDNILEPTCGCLRGVVHNLDAIAAGSIGRHNWPQLGPDVVGIRYDNLVRRFGVKRVNHAIRNRILNNQSRRTLKGVVECATV